MSMRDLRALLWACLHQEDDALTLRDVGALIHPGNMESLGEALSKVMYESLPDADPAEEGEQGSGEPPPSPSAG